MTDLFYKLACEKFDNPAKEIDWSVIGWDDWQQILPSYLVYDIELLLLAYKLPKSYAFDCCVGRVYGNIAAALRDKKIIPEQAQALRRLYVYSMMEYDGKDVKAA